MDDYTYALELPLAPYRFVWKDEPAVDAEKREGAGFSEERYTHSDGTVVIVRAYHADGSFRIMSNRGKIELIDNANNPSSPEPISVVKLP